MQLNVINLLLKLQCLRRYRDTREAFPHLVNAGKYSTTFFVVIFSALNALVVSKYNTEGDKTMIIKQVKSFQYDTFMLFSFIKNI